MAVVLVNGLVGVRAKVQHRAVHDHVVGTDVLRVLGQIQHDIEVGVRARGDDAAAADAAPVTRRLRGFDRHFHQALALGNRHGKELGLLARDEQATQLKVLDPVVQIFAVGFFVDAQVVVKRGQVGGPNAHQVFTGVFFGF